VADTFRDRLRRFRGNVDREEINLVRTYLSHGVVPSTLIRERKEFSPDAVTLINAAYLFYLESLPELMKRIAGQDEQILAHRTRWAERIEMWTLKALEDLSLLSYRQGVASGSAIAQGNR
jgi:hypothetical protein